jgi:hypothetical protein
LDTVLYIYSPFEGLIDIRIMTPSLAKLMDPAAQHDDTLSGRSLADCLVIDEIFNFKLGGSADDLRVHVAIYEPITARYECRWLPFAEGVHPRPIFGCLRRAPTNVTARGSTLLQRQGQSRS